MLPVAAVLADDFRIGVLAFRGNLATVERWQATADYLTEKLPEHRFRIVPLELEQLRASVAAGHVDFVVTNSGQYVELEVFYGLSRIATQKNLVRGKPQTKFGAVIFVRADRTDIQTLEDLKGKSLMGVKEDGFGGFRMAWRELLEHGIDPYEDLSSLNFSGYPHGAVAFAVRDRFVDVGTFQSETLEQMASEGKIDLQDFRVLNPQPMDDYPALHSTALYPTWPFAKVKHVPEPIAEQVAISLLEMPANSTAAKKAHISGWTIPLSYQEVHELMMVLKVGPYAGTGTVTVMDFVRRYKVWIFLVAFTLVALAILSVILARENRTRKQVEKELRLHQDNLQQLVDARSEDVARMRDQAISASEVKSTFMTTISHELRPPLNAIIGECEVMLEDLDFGSDDRYGPHLQQIHASTLHLLGTLGKIMDVSRIDDGSAQIKIEMFSLRDMIDEVTGAVQPLASDNNNLLEVDNRLATDTLQTDRLRLQDALIHVLGNAAKFTHNGFIRFTIRTEIINEQEWIEFVVSDNGIGMSELQRKHVFEVFSQSDGGGVRKFSGIGVGLAISRGYCRMMGGDITFVSTPKKGSEFVIRIPAMISSQRLARARK